MQVLSEVAIERTIEMMWDRYEEPLQLADLAHEAVFSKFYYSRMFRELTGTSPGRFLSAIRLFMAKRLLLETSSSVTSISYRVGYNSLGTFTSRFTRSVSISPARYRTLAHKGLPPIPTFSMSCPGQRMSELTGSLRIPCTNSTLRVYVGAFDSPIVEGLPKACDVLDSSGQFQLSVPDGTWFVRAAAVARHEGEPGARIRRPQLIGTAWPVEVNGAHVQDIDLPLRPAGPFDLPILLALPELDGRYLTPQTQAAG